MTAEPKRFALYARTSTDDNQSPADSLAWQRHVAEQFLSAHDGEITTVYHDVDVSRSLTWRQRPQTQRLLADLKNTDRGWDHVVVAEPHRAFQGTEFGNVLPILSHHGVRLWVPEVGGFVDPDCDHHELLMLIFGGMSKAERNRVRSRVRAAMQSQAKAGRWLGGRPPYGYQLGDTGPHPNPEKARLGARSYVLEIRADTAAIVERIFSLFLSGMGVRTIAAALTAEGIPCPSASDPDRNPHRAGFAWSGSAVRSILHNSTYAGRQQFGKTRRSETLIDPDRPELGGTVRQVSRGAVPVVGDCPVIVDPEVFEAAQNRNGKRPAVRARRARSGKYPLAGLVRCGLCGRAMESRGDRRATGELHVLYRCRLSRAGDYPVAAPDHPPTMAISQKRITVAIDTAFSSLLAGSSLEDWVREIMLSLPEDQSATRSDLLRRLQTATERHKRLVGAVADGFMEAEDISAELNSIKSETADCTSRLKVLGSNKHQMSESDVRSALVNLTELLDTDDTARREILRGFGLHIEFEKTLEGRERLSLVGSLDPGNGRVATSGVGGGT